MNKQNGKETNNDNDLMQVLASLYRGMPHSPNDIFVFIQNWRWTLKPIKYARLH